MPDCICSTPSIGAVRLMFQGVEVPEHSLVVRETVGAVRLTFKGVEVPEHSLVVRETVGSANADTLMCESDYSPCCTLTENGWFFDFDTDGSPRPVNTGAGGWYQTRDDGVVRLHYNGGTSEGILFCRVRASATELQTLYVGVYPTVDDGVGGNGKSVGIPSEIHHTVV